MNKEEILKLLDDDEQYYGEFGKQFRSNSDIKVLFEKPETLFDPFDNQAVPLVFGNYFHKLMLEPEKAADVEWVDVANRKTKKYEAAAKDKTLLIRPEIENCAEMQEKLKSNDIVRGLIYGDHKDANIQYEIPNLVEIGTNTWKGKADIVNHDEKLIIDLKTTSSLDRFRWSSYNYNYDSQAYIYSTMFGYDFVFVVIDKNSHKIGIFDCSPEFLARGEEKVHKANEIYDLFYKTENFKKENFFINQTL
jgi:hypothetical protein